MAKRDSAKYVEAIPGTPLPFGLLSAATVLEPTDPHELNGVEWQPLSCADAHNTDWCSDDPEFDYTKIFDRGETLYAPPVTVYYGRDCTTIGETAEEAETRARAGLAIGEARALEAWLWENTLTSEAVDLTPAAGAVELAVGIGILEGALAASYGGVGVLHSPANASAPMACNSQMYLSGGRMLTWLGNIVSLGAGYTNTAIGSSGDPDPAETGEAWLMISGPVIIRRDGVNVPGDLNDGVDITLNDRFVLAERTSVVGVECGVFSILVTLAAGGGSGSSVSDNDLELES